jgi:hypothetical protein
MTAASELALLVSAHTAVPTNVVGKNVAQLNAECRGCSRQTARDSDDCRGVPSTSCPDQTAYIRQLNDYVAQQLLALALTALSARKLVESSAPRQTDLACRCCDVGPA